MPTNTQPIPRRLFEPLRVGRLTLKNRIVMAPMTRCRAVDINVPSDLVVEYYAQRAGAGLIVTEATQVSVGAQGYWRTPGLHTERQCAVWRRAVERVHGEGGRIFVQLWHNGRIFHPDNVGPGLTPVAPSPIAANVRLMTPNGLRQASVPQELDARGIGNVTNEFVGAARLAVECGFDGVEIHAANGYLFDQFLHRSSNRRTDDWGGSIENRSRFLLETTNAVCRSIGADRVGVRVSPLGTFNDVQDPEPDEIYRHLATRLTDQGLAYLHVIRPAVSGSLTLSAPIADPLPEIRSLYRGTLLVAGDLDVASADHLIDSGLADGVAFGRWFIGNPDLTERLRHGWPLAVADRAIYYSGGAQGYTDFARYERSRPATSTATAVRT
jgi:N-ethylmaleimide reductase